VCAAGLYQAERRQFRSVMLYGTPEKSSVDFLLLILQKVGLFEKKNVFLFKKV
jgi:hypothetical protein